MTDNESIEETKSQDDDASKNDPEDATEEKNEPTWEEKYNDAYDALLRAKAEVENIKKRSEKANPGIMNDFAKDGAMKTKARIILSKFFIGRLF